MNGGGGQMEQAGEDDNLVTEDMLWHGAQGENPRDAYVMDLHNRGLTHVTSLEQCTRLRSLDLSFNKLTSLAGLSSLRDLRELKLYGNYIQFISGLERLSSLTTLLLHDNLIEKIEGLDNLRSLKHLRLDGNRLTGASRLSRLTSLTSLNLSRNSIKTLHPRAFEGMTSLEELDLSSNQLTSVESVGKCTKLQELQLSRNRLSTLASLPSIASLDIVYVEDNRVTSMQGLPVLPMLTELYASGNGITTLDGLAESCPSLEILDVRNNRLSDDTSMDALKSLGQLAELSIAGNPFNTTNKRLLLTPLLALALVDDLPVADMHVHLEAMPETDEDAKDLEAFKARMGIRTDIRIVNGQISALTGNLTPAAAAARPKTPASRPATPMSRPGTPGQAGSSGKPHTPMMHQRPLSARTGGGQKLLSTREFAHAAEQFKQQMQSYRSELDAVIAALREGLARDPKEGGMATRATEWRLRDPPVMATISSHILALPPGQTGDDIPATSASTLGRKPGASSSSSVSLPAEGTVAEARVETSPRQRATRGGKGGEVVRESVMNLRSSAIREALVLYAQVLGTKESASEDTSAKEEASVVDAPTSSRPTSSSASTRDNDATDHNQAATPTSTQADDAPVIPDTEVDLMTTGLNTRMRPLDTDFSHDDVSTVSTLHSTLSSSRTHESEQSDTTILGGKGGNASLSSRQAQQMRPRAVGYKSFRLPSARQEGPAVAVGATQQHTRQ